MVKNNDSKAIGIMAVIVISFIAWIVNGINNLFVSAPNLNVSGATKNDAGYTVELTNKYTDVTVYIGDKANVCDKKNNFSVKVNGVEVAATSNSSCYYVIKNGNIPDGKTTYNIVARNKKGEDKMTLTVVKDIEVKENNSDTPKTSSGTDLQIAAHLACKHYAEDHFFPLKVKLETVLTDGSDDPDGDGWFYRPIAKVTSSAGGTTRYQVTCKTDSEGHVTSFSAWQ